MENRLLVNTSRQGCLKCLFNPLCCLLLIFPGNGSPSAHQRRFLSFFLVLLCCRLTEERVRASKSFNASWCRIGLNHSQEPLPLIWIAAIILVKGWWWRASEAFHLHAASGGSSAQISLECSCSQRGCAGVKWSRMQSDRGAGRRRVTALAD